MPLSQRLENERGSLVIVAAIAMVVVLVGTTKGLQLLRSISHRDQVLTLTSFEAFPATELNVWHGYYQNEAAAVSDGTYQVSLDTNLTSGNTVIANQSYSQGTPEGTPYNLKATLPFDPNPMLLSRVPANSLSVTFATLGSQRIFCGKYSPASKTHKVCTSAPAAPPVLPGGANRCGTVDFCQMASSIPCPPGLTGKPTVGIFSEADLAAIVSDNYYTLMNDITMTAPFTPLAPVSNVVLDGQGHRIVNLNITTPTAGKAGLFSTADSIIFYNIILQDPTVGTVASPLPANTIAGTLAANVTGTSCLDSIIVSGGSVVGGGGPNPPYYPVGGVIGDGTGARINMRSVSATNHVQSSGAAAGGIIGNMGTISATGEYYLVNLTRTAGNVLGTGMVGGLVGSLQGNDAKVRFATVSDISVGDSSSVGSIGGVVGYLPAKSGEIFNATVQNLTLNVPNANGVGGILGNTVNGVSIQVSGAPAMTPTGAITCKGDCGGGVGNLAVSGNSTVAFINSSMTIAATGSSVGGVIGRGFAGGSSTLIATDINATGGTTITGSGNVGGVIGSMQGHSVFVSNSTSDRPIRNTGNYGGGLVGSLGASAGGALTNSWAIGGVEGAPAATPTSYVANYCGGLVGSASGIIISNSHASGDVHCRRLVGGLVGGAAGMSPLTIQDSYATGDVSAIDNVGAPGQPGGIAGGLVGQHYGGIIRKSYAIGNVTSNGNNLGGLVGLAGTDIDRSYATGNVLSTGTDNGQVGGLIGNANTCPALNPCSITNSYARGSVTQNFVNPINGRGYSGGLIGQLNPYNNVTNCYSSGRVTDPNGLDASAFIGNFYPLPPVGGGSPVVTNSYWDTTTAAKPGTGYGTGRADLRTNQAGYTGWDFATIWLFVNGQYPTLR